MDNVEAQTWIDEHFRVCINTYSNNKLIVKSIHKDKFSNNFKKYCETYPIISKSKHGIIAERHAVERCYKCLNEKPITEFNCYGSLEHPCFECCYGNKKKKFTLPIELWDEDFVEKFKKNKYRIEKVDNSEYKPPGEIHDKALEKQLTDKINELFYYDHDTGVFTCKVKRGRNNVIGGKVGLYPTYNNGTDYILIKIDHVSYKAQDLVWLLEKGEFPRYCLYHSDHNTINNKIDNLRESRYPHAPLVVGKK